MLHILNISVKFVVEHIGQIRKLAKSNMLKFLQESDILKDMKNNTHTLEKIIQVLNDLAPESEVYLYGSRARGNAKELSDWYILILLAGNNLTFDKETKILDHLYELELQTGEIISPLIYLKNDWKFKNRVTPLYKNINKEGIRIK